ncbi:ABC transporter ATP-binding protein [Pseudonocardia acaciae]|uniref:ABC transporter ATP-binding protein n=1 Tax=Pseudonocardia acaciae TaxID=551276 RepID=UPI0006850D14|nr:ABC transporter ATP-binding protein [Pseudonocardia acaciae]
MSAAPVLELHGLTKRYGAITANAGVSLAVRAGARHALIGPNGAGKSTLFAMVAGSLPVTAGAISFLGEDITRLPRHARVARGLTATFQHSSLFASGTAADNVALAVQRRLGLSARLARPADRFADIDTAVGEQLRAVGLDRRRDTPVHSLSHGERRQLEVALALATRPRLLLLDEPTAGMSPSESDRFVALIGSLPEDMTILIVEHDMNVVFRLATHLTVLHLGSLLADGRPEEIRQRRDVQAAYLGDGAGEDLFTEPSTSRAGAA